jgi:tagatose-1,6-bisphosphate aldolase
MSLELMTSKTRTPRPEPVGTAMLKQLAELEPESLSPATARKLLELNFSRRQQKRVDLLSEKAQEGTLTAAEQDELDEFIRVADLLAILQSRARRALKHADPSS